MSLINAIGRIIHEEQSANRNPVDKLSRELNGIRIFEPCKGCGETNRGGFAHDKCSIEGLGKDQGYELRLHFRMVLLAETPGENRGQYLDLICLLDLETGSLSH